MEVACVFENVEFRVVFTRLFVTCVSPTRGLFGEICRVLFLFWWFSFFGASMVLQKKREKTEFFCENRKDDKRQRVARFVSFAPRWRFKIS